MPYIKKETRAKIADCQNMLALLPSGGPNNAGELNFTITMLLHNYLQRIGVSYLHLNEVIGILECAKMELYRQIAAPYEDKKKQENGSISGLDNDSSEKS